MREGTAEMRIPVVARMKYTAGFLGAAIPTNTTSEFRPRLIPYERANTDTRLLSLT